MPHTRDELIAIAVTDAGCLDGTPTRIVSVTGRMIRLPRRIAARPPWIATGTIGACALMRHDEAALLERQQLVGLAARALPGKSGTSCPTRIDAAPASIERIAASLFRRSTGMNPPIRNARARTGIWSISCL